MPGLKLTHINNTVPKESKYIEILSKLILFSFEKMFVNLSSAG